MLRIALRQGRRGLVAATALAAVNGLALAFGYAAIAGTAPASRAAFAAQMELLGRQLTFLLPVPEQVATLAGFLQWRHFGALPLVYAVWALLAAAGAARGDEERGQVEQWLATGLSRSRYLAARGAAFALLVSLSVALAVTATLLGSVLAGGDTLPAGGLVAQGAALVALSLACFAIGLAAAQLAVTGRAAAGAAALVLGVAFLIAGAARSGALEAIAPLSPFWQYDRTRALLEGGALDLPSLAALAGMATFAGGLAFVAFARRDLGSSVLPRRISHGAAQRVPAGRPSLRLPVIASLDRQAAGLLGWGAALAALALFLGSLLPTMIGIAKDVPLLRLMVLRGAIADLDAAFVGAVWGNTALLALSAYAISQVAGWVADEADGRLEMALSAPVPRSRIVLERAAVLTLGTAFLVAVATAALAAMTRASGLAVDLGALAGASALLVPLVVAFGAIGAALIGWWPRAAVVILGVVAAESYFIQQLAPMLDFPDAVRRLSLFELYGAPLVLGPSWSGLATQLGIVVVGFGVALFSMSRRDIAR